jgi:hypothetical protein
MVISARDFVSNDDPKNKPPEAGERTVGELIASGEMDVGVLEIQILIVCKNPAALQPSASFLSRRGWPTTIVGNLSKAIDQILKVSPDFIFLSCNHPNPNLYRLPTLIERATTSQCVGFAEQSDALGVSRLAALTTTLKLQGMPTGPAIQRLIRRALIDLYSHLKPHEGSAEKGGEHESGGFGNSMFRGKARSPDDKIEAGNYTMSLGPQNRLRLKELVPQKQTTEEMQRNKAEAAALRELAKEADSRGESGVFILPTKADPTQNSSDLDYKPSPQFKLSGSKEEDLIQKGIGLGGAYSATQEGPGQGTEHSAEKGKLNNREYLARQEGVVGKGFSAKQSAELGKELSAQSGADNSKFKRASAFDENDTPESLIYQGLFEKSVESALATICLKDDGGHLEIDYVSVLGVIPFDAPDLHGYLIVTLATSGVDEQKLFLERLHGTLKVIFTDNGMTINLMKGFVVVQDKFDFWDWARTEGKIVVTSVDGGQQVGVCLLATAKRPPTHRDIAHKNMAAINVEHVEPEEPITFKAYLHFKSSDRYYLYLRNGRKLAKKQKERLLKRKVSELFIKTIDAENFQSYVACTVIRNSIKKSRGSKAS